MNDFAAYCFYVNRPDLLSRAVDAFPDLWPELTIVDNSNYGVDVTLPDSVDIYAPPVPFTYSQSCNWMLKDATTKKKDFIIHFHSDATTANPNAVQELLAYARQCKEEGRQWGCLWTFYDILWAVNPAAMNQIGGWDTNLPNYFTDNDLRHRLLLSGWETINTNIQGMSHEGSATINSDPYLRHVTQIIFPLNRAYYHAKWAGEPGKEIFTRPFDLF